MAFELHTAFEQFGDKEKNIVNQTAAYYSSGST
jgi:hypothetical protein